MVTVLKFGGSKQVVKSGLVWLLLVAAASANAADLQWSGLYRAEGVFLKNRLLDKNLKQNDDTSYLLHHLILKPKIIAADGFNIYSRFDIFNNALGNNQAGQTMGSYSGTTTNAAGTQSSPPAVLTKTQQDETILVSELYLNWVSEFGALVVGRVPFSFGLGMAYNAGDGIFDHALSTKDMVGYKLVLANFTLMPAYGKIRESDVTREDDVNELLVVLDYTNPETDLSMGFLFDTRYAPQGNGTPVSGNDFPTLAGYYNTTSVVLDGFSAYNMNFYVKKKTENFNVGAELGFLNGYSGLKVADASGNYNRVELSGFGLAGELGYKTGNWNLGLKAGLASGDDPDTTRFEGYYFSPNYDVAMIMFNHVLGQYDVLRSTLSGSRAASSSSNTNANNLAGLDSEVISNAVYVAPQFKLRAGDNYELMANFCYAVTHKNPIGGGASVSNGLGLETDLGLIYKPNDRFTWLNQIGLFFPGGAWAGSTSLRSDFAYGVTTKAAISF